MLSKYIRLPYIYLFILIIWMPFSNYLNIDKAGRFPMFLSIAFILLYIVRKSYRIIYKQLSIKILLCLFVYMIITYISRNVIIEPTIIKFYRAYTFIHVFLGFTIIYYEFIYGRVKEILNMLMVSSVVWLLFALLMNGFDLSTSARSNIEGIDGNDFALAATFVIYCIYLSYCLWNQISFCKILLLFLCLFLIIVSGSRTAFGCLSAIALCVVINQLKNITPSKILFTVIFIIGAYIAIIYVLNYTAIGERLLSTTSQAEDIGLENTGIILNMLGDRGGFYYYGWFEFLRNPWFGVGLLNFGPLSINNGYVCHSEYIVQLCENGIFAFSAYIIFLISLYFKIKNSCSAINKNILYTGLFIVCFTAIFFWTYDRYYVLAIYGIILGLTTVKKI